MPVRELYADEAVVLIHKNHRSPKGGRLSPARFNALRHVDTWLVLGERSAGHRVAEDFFERHGLKRNFALVVPSFFTAAMMAAKRPREVDLRGDCKIIAAAQTCKFR